MKLQGRVAVITGGARGIGKAIALTLAGEGADIVLCDLLDEGEETAREIISSGRQAQFHRTDITRMVEVEAMIKKTLDRLGRVDILVNNAGITRDGLLMRMTEEDWDKVIEVNLKGTFNCTRVISRVMVKQRSGSIINIASVIGIVGNVGQANYAASKAGIIGLTKSAARELAPRGIRVNAVAPGFIRTQMTERLSPQVKEEMGKRIPLGRFGEAEDVAKVVLFLVSDDAAYITGQVISVSGGMVM